MAKAMTLEFEIKRQDYIDFNFHFIRTNPQMKRTLLLGHVVPPVIFLALPFLMQSAMRDSNFLFGFILLGLMAASWLGFWPVWFKKSFFRRLNRLLNEGKLAGIVGHHEVTLNDDAITDRTPVSETRYQTIERVETTARFLYVWVSPVAAFLIPRTVFENADRESQFVDRAGKMRGSGE